MKLYETFMTILAYHKIIIIFHNLPNGSLPNVQFFFQSGQK